VKLERGIEMNRRVKLAFSALLMASLACTAPFGFTFGNGGPRTRGSGNEVTISPEVSGFDSLDIGHTFEVDIIQSQTYSLVVTVDDNIEQYLVIDDSGGTLTLNLEADRSYSDVTLKAQISMPTLSELELSGASKAEFTQFASSDPFDLRVSGASEAKGDIEAGDVTIKVSGASEGHLHGEGQDLLLEVSGASHVDLGEFTVEDATLDLSGASEVTVNVNGILNVNASGASDVTYVGNPILGDMETSGASSIQSGK
jgi:hypothetical protein